jgi:hypothetical protein
MCVYLTVKYAVVRPFWDEPYKLCAFMLWFSTMEIILALQSPEVHYP